LNSNPKHRSSRRQQQRCHKQRQWHRHRVTNHRKRCIAQQPRRLIGRWPRWRPPVGRGAQS